MLHTSESKENRNSSGCSPVGNPYLMILGLEPHQVKPPAKINFYGEHPIEYYKEAKNRLRQAVKFAVIATQSWDTGVLMEYMQDTLDPKKYSEILNTPRATVARMVISLSKQRNALLNVKLTDRQLYEQYIKLTKYGNAVCKLKYKYGIGVETVYKILLDFGLEIPYGDQINGHRRS